MKRAEKFYRSFFQAVVCGVLFLGALLCCPLSIFAQEAVEPSSVLSPAHLDDLLNQAWAASGKSDYKMLNESVDAVLAQYRDMADALSFELKDFPSRDKVEEFRTMNQVATVLFIRGESLMHQGKNDVAIAELQALIKSYPYAQSWDPSRGSYWSIAEKSQASINVMMGQEAKEVRQEAQKTKPKLFLPGKDKIVDYSQYGTFSGVGTKDYKFQITNPNILAKAVGEGIYPNTGDVLRNPRYRQVVKEQRLQGSHWDFVNTMDLEAAYFKWVTAPESWGVKLFYIGLIFEKAEMNLEAIKAYHALVVNFPNAIGWTYWHTVWYPAQAAVSKIANILRIHPELGLEYKDGKIQVFSEEGENGQKRTVFVSNPGVIRKAQAKKKLSVEERQALLGKPQRHLGGKKTELVQYENGQWQMRVDGKPFMIRGITYLPTKVGQSPDKGTMVNWMTEDTNNNGRADAPYDSWVDKNRNNVQDANEPVVGDFQLLKEMGVNTLRFYHQPHEPDKEVLRDLYARYGIRIIMSDFFGKYAIGSGADWATGTDYENPVHRENMLKSVEKMVNEFKDEPYVLMWALGNENNYGVASNADKKPDAYYKFVNDVAKRIKEIDPDRPVAMVNGDVLFLEKFAANAPDVDVFGANVYRGDYGFGSFWDEVRRATDKPAFISEYGAPAYSKQVDMDEAELQQSEYYQGCWLDILENSAGHEGEGNSIGGVTFEWTDEWYKNYEPSRHDTKADVVGPFAGGYYYEEWFGITNQGNGKTSPFLRQLRKAYFMYKKLWN